MKSILLVLAVVLSVISACQKEKSDFTAAEITGIDYRKCASPFCGGYFIKIEGQTFRFLALPEKHNLDEDFHDKFPYPVAVKWHDFNDPQFPDVQDLIVVEEIQKR